MLSNLRESVRPPPRYVVVHQRQGKSPRYVYDSSNGDPASFVDASRRVAEIRHRFGFPGGTMSLLVDGVCKKEWHCAAQAKKTTPSKHQTVIDLSQSPPKKAGRRKSSQSSSSKISPQLQKSPSIKSSSAIKAAASPSKLTKISPPQIDLSKDRTPSPKKLSKTSSLEKKRTSPMKSPLQKIKTAALGNDKTSGPLKDAVAQHPAKQLLQVSSVEKKRNSLTKSPQQIMKNDAETSLGEVGGSSTSPKKGSVLQKPLTAPSGGKHAAAKAEATQPKTENVDTSPRMRSKYTLSPKKASAPQPASIQQSRKSPVEKGTNPVKSPQRTDVLPKQCPSKQDRSTSSLPKGSTPQSSTQQHPSQKSSPIGKKRASAGKPLRESTNMLLNEGSRNSKKDRVAASPSKKSNGPQKPGHQELSKSKGEAGKSSSAAAGEAGVVGQKDHEVKSKADSAKKATGVSRRQDDEVVATRTPERGNLKETVQTGPREHQSSAGSFAVNDIVFYDSKTSSGSWADQFMLIHAINDDGTFDVRAENGRLVRIFKSVSRSQLTNLTAKQRQVGTAMNVCENDWAKTVAMSPSTKSSPKKRAVTTSKSPRTSDEKKKRRLALVETPVAASPSKPLKESFTVSKKDQITASPSKKDRGPQQPGNREPQLSKGEDSKSSIRATERGVVGHKDHEAKGKTDSGKKATDASRPKGDKAVATRTPERGDVKETAPTRQREHQRSAGSFAVNEIVFYDCPMPSGRWADQVMLIHAINDDGTFDVRAENGRLVRVYKSVSRSKLTSLQGKPDEVETGATLCEKDIATTVAMSPPKNSCPKRRAVTTSKSPQTSEEKKKRRLAVVETPRATSPSPKRRAVTASKKPDRKATDEESDEKPKKKHNIGEFVTADDFLNLPPVNKKRRPCPPHVANTIFHLIRDDADHGMTASVIEGQLASPTGPVLPRPKLAQAAWDKLLEATDARTMDSARSIVDMCFKTISPGRADIQEPWLPAEDLKQQSLVDTMYQVVSRTNALSCLDALVTGLKDICPKSKLASRLADGRIASALLDRFNECHARGDAGSDEQIVVHRALAFLASLDAEQHIVTIAKAKKCDAAALCNALAVACTLDDNDKNAASPFLVSMIKSLADTSAAAAKGKKKVSAMSGLARRTLAFEKRTSISKPNSPLDKLVNSILLDEARTRKIATT